MEMSDNKKTVSIVVPLYQVECYCGKCLESVVNQTYRDIEILMTDDGSPDKSGILADELALQDERAIVIHQQNKWLGGARNTGIKLVSGEHIFFVDSDDYIRLDACEKLMQVVEKNDVDMILFDIQHVDGEYHEGIVASPQIEVNKCIYGEEARDILFDLIISSHTINNAWMKLYKTSLFQQNGLLFDESIRYAEDYEFCLRMYPHVNSILHLNQPLYYYVFNDKSIMHSADPQIVDKFILLYRHREKFMRNHRVNSENHKKQSAILLLTMIAKCLPKYIGSKSISLSWHEIRKVFDKPEIYEALERVQESDCQLGRLGRVTLWGIRHRCTCLVVLAERLLRKSEGRFV